MAIFGVFIHDKFQISVAYSEKNLFCRTYSALPELLFKPGHVQPHALEIVLLDLAVHNQLRKHQLLLRGRIHVARRDGPLPAHRQDGELSVVFKNRRLDTRQVEVSSLLEIA